jgi:hypothetical protein
MSYNLLRCIYDGMEGHLQSRFSEGKQVLVANGMAYIHVSGNANNP